MLAIILPGWSLRAKVALLALLYLVIILPATGWPWRWMIVKLIALLILYFVMVPRLLAHALALPTKTPVECNLLPNSEKPPAQD